MDEALGRSATTVTNGMLSMRPEDWQVGDVRGREDGSYEVTLNVAVSLPKGIKLGDEVKVPKEDGVVMADRGRVSRIDFNPNTARFRYTVLIQGVWGVHMRVYDRVELSQ